MPTNNVFKFNCIMPRGTQSNSLKMCLSIGPSTREARCTQLMSYETMFISFLCVHPHGCLWTKIPLWAF